MRATQTTTYRSLQAFLDKSSDRLASLQLQAATGKRLNRPSDDPTAISPVLSARTQIQTSNRYIETIASGLDRINGTDGYLDGIENTLVRLKEIGIASVNGSLSPQDMQTYADEVAQLRATLLDAGNAQIDGKYLFAGYNEKTAPFTVNPNYPATETNPVNYTGDYGELQLEISPNELIGVNLTGNTLFLGDANNDGVVDPGAVDIFALAANLENALRGNNLPTGQPFAGPTAATTTPYAAPVPEVQSLDLTGLSLAAGETLTLSFGGDSYVYTNSSGVAQDAAAVTAALNGLGTLSAGTQNFVVAGAGTTITLAQAAGEEGPIGEFTVASSDTDPLVTTATEGTPGSAVIAEVQSLDLASTTVAAGESLTLTVDGTDFIYTNSTGGPLTNNALVADIVAGLAVANYTLSNGGSGGLTLTQNAGSESDIVPVTTSNSASPKIQALLDPLERAANQVRGQRSLKGNIGRRLETASEHMQQIKIDMEEFRSRYEDADILKTITDLQQQEQSFQAALSVTGRVSALSILDYI